LIESLFTSHKGAQHFRDAFINGFDQRNPVQYVIKSLLDALIDEARANPANEDENEKKNQNTPTTSRLLSTRFRKPMSLRWLLPL
jgi:hypothetical protein